MPTKTAAEPIEVDDTVVVLSGTRTFLVARIDGDTARIVPAADDGDGQWISLDLLRHPPTAVDTMAALVAALAEAMSKVDEHWGVHVREVDEAIGRVGNPLGNNLGHLAAQVHAWAEALRADAADPQ